MLSKLRSGVTYANVVSSIALFLALGGGAYAASSLVAKDGKINGCVSKRGVVRLVASGKKCAKGERVVAWNQQGPRGLSGASGARGDQGQQGLPGAPGQPGEPGQRGSPAASALTARVLRTPTTAPAMWFGAVSGISQGTTAGETTVRQLSPNALVVARDLAVQAVDPPIGDTGYRVTLMDDGAATALTCELRSATNSRCDSGPADAQISPGSRLSFRIQEVASGSLHPAGSDLEIGWRATTP